MIAKINLDEKAAQIDKPWSPIDIARVNDHVVRMALIEGEYHWHKHTNEDELFFVYDGEIIIQLRGQPDLTLHEGEMAVIPEGVEHCPKSAGPSYILVFKRHALVSSGD